MPELRHPNRDLTKGEREELDATCYDDDVEHSITGIRKKADAFEVTFLYNAKDATSDYRVLGSFGGRRCVRTHYG